MDKNSLSMVWLMGHNAWTISPNCLYPTTLANTSLEFLLSLRIAVTALRKLQHNFSNMLLSCEKTYCNTQLKPTIKKHDDKNDTIGTLLFCVEMIMFKHVTMLVKHFALINWSCNRRLLWLLWLVIIGIVSELNIQSWQCKIRKICSLEPPYKGYYLFCYIGVSLRDNYNSEHKCVLIRSTVSSYSETCPL